MKESDLQNIIDGLEQLEKATNGHLGDWKHYLSDANTIWQKCPYQVGARVALIKSPLINEKESWGWLGAKHFLIEGSIATVKIREFYHGRFVFGLHFDDETWIDHNGKRNVPNEKALYMFGETWLIHAPDKQETHYVPLSCEAL